MLVLVRKRVAADKLHTQAGSSHIGSNAEHGGVRSQLFEPPGSLGCDF
jgi:hypothetical protein